MRSLQARIAAAAAPIIYLAASPMTVAFAAGTSTVADPYGEHTKLDLGRVTTNASQASPGSNAGALAKTIVGLAIVIAVIYGLTWVLRQLKQSREGTGFGGLVAEASVPLGPGRSVHLIRAGRELVLVGSAEHGVTPIRTYTEDEALELGLIDEDNPEDADAAPAKPVAAVISSAIPALERLREKTLR